MNAQNVVMTQLVTVKKSRRMTEGASHKTDNLIEDLKSNDWDVCRTAAEELGKIGDESAVDPLIKMIEETHVIVLKATIGVGSSEIAAYPAEAVDAAITALGKIGDMRAVELLIKLLEDSKETKWQSEIVDEWGPFELLEKLPPESVSDAYDKLGLHKELGSKKARTFKEFFEQIGHYERKVYAESLRLHSAEALGYIGDVCAVKPLIKALEDENEYVRAHAAWALGEIGDARAVGSLVELLEDNARLLPGKDSVQSHAARALGLIGDTSAVKPLKKALNDKDHKVRKMVKEALRKLGY
tara:strand:- start:147 stop:1043 length:897 start_codon:yes stop_codon:yes gene_type:complete